MLRTLHALYSIVFWTYLALSSVVLFVLALALFVLTFPFDRKGRWLHLFTCFWAHHYVWLNPLWSLTIRGREHLDRAGSPAVLVANHQSLGDILILFGLFRFYKWVSKASIFAVPFVGWNMRLNRYVSLVRGDKASIAEMLDECRAWLRRGVSVLLFPEGTRSLDGEIKDFKTGAFALAAELRVPLVPIVIDGTRDVLPKHGFVMKSRCRVRMEVLQALHGDDAAALLDETRTRMIAELARIRS